MMLILKREKLHETMPEVMAVKHLWMKFQIVRRKEFVGNKFRTVS